MKIPDTNKIFGIVYLIAGLLVLFIIYKILTGIGIIKTAAKKKEKAAVTQAESDLRAMDYFNPMFLKDKLDIYTNKLGNQAKDFAVQLRKAVKGLGTNEENIYSVFGQMRCKWNIAEVSMYYKYAYNRDLLADLMNDLTDKEQFTLYEMINKLPEK